MAGEGAKKKLRLRLRKGKVAVIKRGEKTLAEIFPGSDNGRPSHDIFGPDDLTIEYRDLTSTEENQ